MSRHGITLALCSLLALVGCNTSEESESYEDAPLSENTDHDHHAHEGAHGGLVIEFDAAHAHHAELAFDEASRDITLYFYGATIGEAHSATGLVFELEEGDDELHLETAASPLEGETEETASRFTVAGSEVPENITGDTLHGHFHVTLDGQDFKGSFGEHDHDHGEEGHEEHDEHGDHDEDDDHEDGHDDEDGHDEDEEHDEDEAGEEDKESPEEESAE